MLTECVTLESAISVTRLMSGSGFLTHDFDLERDVTEFAPSAQPQRQQHFCASSGRNIAQIQDVFPAETFQKRAHLSFGGLVVTAHEDGVVRVLETAGFEHQLRHHGVQGFNDVDVWVGALNLFGQAIGVADSL